MKWRPTRPPIGFRLPNYNRCSTQISGPFELEGACLVPWLRSGDFVWIDRAQAPRDGDLVSAELRVRYRRKGPLMPGIAEVEYRTHSAIKLYRERDGEGWLVCHDGSYRSAAHVVSGVVVGVVCRPTSILRMGRPKLETIARDFPEVAPHAAIA